MTNGLKGLGLPLVRGIHSKTTRDLKNHLNNARKELDRLDLQRGDQYTIQNNLRCLELINHNINEIKWGLKRKEEQHASCNKSNDKLLEWSWDKRYMF